VKLPTEAETRSDDLVQPFRIDPFALRGRLVRLGPTVDRILSQHDYPEPVAAILGEAIALAVVLAGALKYDGIFTLQTKSDGPVRLIVADVSTEGAVRGYAQYDRERVDAVPNNGNGKPGASPVRALSLGCRISAKSCSGAHTKISAATAGISAQRYRSGTAVLFRRECQQRCIMARRVGTFPAPLSGTTCRH
jgi:molecular chaperone Hsp33